MYEGNQVGDTVFDECYGVNLVVVYREDATLCVTNGNDKCYFMHLQCGHACCNQNNLRQDEVVFVESTKRYQIGDTFVEPIMSCDYHHVVFSPATVSINGGEI